MQFQLGALSSVQSGPVQDADVIRIKVEILREQGAQLAIGARRVQRLPQLDYTAPLAAVRDTRRRAAVGNEVRVVLCGHGQERSSVARAVSVRCSTERRISVKVRAT